MLLHLRKSRGLLVFANFRMVTKMIRRPPILSKGGGHDGWIQMGGCTPQIGPVLLVLRSLYTSGVCEFVVVVADLFKH